MQILATVRAGIGRIYRSLFFGKSGTLSLGRVMIAFTIVNIWALVWLFVAWVWYVTVTGQMEAAAGLAQAFAAILSAILSSSMIVTGFQWWVAKRYGDAGSATLEQVNDPNASLAASSVPFTPAYAGSPGGI